MQTKDLPFSDSRQNCLFPLHLSMIVHQLRHQQTVDHSPILWKIQQCDHVLYKFHLRLPIAKTMKTKKQFSKEKLFYATYFEKSFTISWPHFQQQKMPFQLFSTIYIYTFPNDCNISLCITIYWIKFYIWYICFK